MFKHVNGLTGFIRYSVLTVNKFHPQNVQMGNISIQWKNENVLIDFVSKIYGENIKLTCD